ncbi:MAG: hypothetical protein DRH04_04910 [Deltaproteobacteria bacterium]|nr:MAG: hypothetical protein DRH04_04910 [Deltaproteobacteria bacterium]
MIKFKKLVFTVLSAMLVVASVLPAAAGYGAGDGSGPMASIFDGTPVTVNGVVSALPSIDDRGLKVDTGEEIVAVYGIGSPVIWERLGFMPLEVGEEVSIEAYEVTFSDDSSKLIAVTVTSGDQTVTLRDPETGKPVWRGCQYRCRQGKNTAAGEHQE